MTARSPLLALVALTAARLLHPGPPPRAHASDWTPDASALRALTLGHPTLAATAVWARTISSRTSDARPAPAFTITLPCFGLI